MQLFIVELKRAELILASFTRKRGQLTFEEAARHPLADEADFARLLQEHAPPSRQERRVVLALPPSSLFMRELELPLKDRHKIRELLPLELKGETAMETDQLVFDALPLEEGKALAVWAKRQAVEDTIRVMAEQGLEPEFVTASCFNWHHVIPAEATAGTVAITNGESLAVFRDTKPIYFRSLASGDPEAEITRTLAALRIGKGLTIDRVFAHGGHSRRAAGAEAGKETTFPPLPVCCDFAEAFTGDADSARDLAGAYAVARGAATGELLNLRHGTLAYTAGQKKTLRRLRLTMILAAALVVLLFAQLGLRYYLVKRDIGSLNGSIRTIYREAFPTRKKPVDEVAELRSEIKRLSGSKVSSNALLVMKKLAEAKGDDIFGIFETELDGSQVRLKGDARSFQAVNDFKSKVGDILSNAEVGETKSRPDGSVTFVLRGTVKEGSK